MSTTDKFASNFYLLLPTGVKAYPVRMKNRDTGRMAFRVPRHGNTKDDSIEVEDEAELLRLCESGQYRVRVAARSPGAPASLVLPDLKSRLVKL